MKSAASTLVALVVVAVSASAQTMVYGETIKRGATTHRLWASDAAESEQACGDGWPAGRASPSFLCDLIGERCVTCKAKTTEARTTDRYGRTVARCCVGDDD